MNPVRPRNSAPLRGGCIEKRPQYLPARCHMPNYSLIHAGPAWFSDQRTPRSNAYLIDVVVVFVCLFLLLVFVCLSVGCCCLFVLFCCCYCCCFVLLLLFFFVVFLPPPLKNNVKNRCLIIYQET